jgi:hypothetical protein
MLFKSGLHHQKLNSKQHEVIAQRFVQQCFCTIIPSSVFATVTSQFSVLLCVGHSVGRFELTFTLMFFLHVKMLSPFDFALLQYDPTLRVDHTDPHCSGDEPSRDWFAEETCSSPLISIND